MMVVKSEVVEEGKEEDKWVRQAGERGRGGRAQRQVAIYWRERRVGKLPS